MSYKIKPSEALLPTVTAGRGPPVWGWTDVSATCSVETMGWRDRDYAQFTESERDAIYGGSRATTRVSAPSHGRSLFKPGVGIAIAVSAGLFALGHLPRGHPLIPALRLNLPRLTSGGARSAQTLPLNVPSTAPYGSVLTLSGTAPNATAGVVVASGQWNGGGWNTVASAPLAADHSWSLPVSMNQHGMLSLKVSLSGGDNFVGSVYVQP